MKLSSEIKVIEALPYPEVTYPRGAFPVFRELGKQPYVLCACMEKAIENYLKLRSCAHPTERALDTWNFPKSYVHWLEEKYETSHGTTYGAEPSIHFWRSEMTFVPDLCHRCNLSKPSIEFCPPSEGTKFRHQYGWYLDMKHYEFGVVPRLQRYLNPLESQGLTEVIDYKYSDLHEDMLYDMRIEHFDEGLILQWLQEHDSLWERGMPRFWDPQYPYNFTEALSAQIEKRQNAVRRYIEDAIRVEFKFMPIAGRWKSEQQLYEIVKKLLPKKKIRRHYRPRFLDHLELDIYLPELEIGIEYQGIQHYEAVKYFGGKRGLEKVKERDARKLQLAEEKGLHIIYFHHYEVLTPELVHKKLKPLAQAHLISPGQVGRKRHK